MITGRTTLKNHINVVINKITISSTSILSKNHKATLPLIAKSKNWNEGNDEAMKYTAIMVVITVK